MYYAVEGCAHGQLDLIYDAVSKLEAFQEIKIDLLILCGDLQASRNVDDLYCVAVPEKYRHMGDFFDYYSGKKRAPVLTLVVGGNHEASNYLNELYYGGWLAPKIYYLGRSGCLRFSGLRIAGLSGIYHKNDQYLPYRETPPYTENSKRSSYHTRQFEIDKLALLPPDTVDILITHEWPEGITRFGNEKSLLRRKPFFEKDIRLQNLGNPSTMVLGKKLRPSYWFSAHLHCKFAALISHSEGKRDFTRFLALDKPGPRRNFIQVLYAPQATSTRELALDPDWVAILQNTHQQTLQQFGTLARALPPPPSIFEKKRVEQMGDQSITIPPFCCDRPYGWWSSEFKSEQFLSMKNTQTTQLLKLLNLPNHPQKIPYSPFNDPEENCKENE